MPVVHHTAEILAVVFDWGGTLTPFIAAEELVDVWRLAARHLAPDRELEMVKRLIDVEESFWQRVRTDQRSFRLAEVLTTATEQLGLDVAEALFEEAAVHHLDAWTPHIRHDPEAPDVMRELRARGMRIGLLSNTHWPRAFHDHFLERDGMSDLIDARLYTSELEFQKPHPSTFRAILDALGVGAPSAVFVGDRPWDDIHGAKEAGMRTVLRPNEHVPSYDVRPDAVIEKLGELPALLDRWSGL